jgi:hypothetical protein
MRRNDHWTLEIRFRLRLHLDGFRVIQSPLSTLYGCTYHFSICPIFCWIGVHFFLSSISIFLYEKIKRIGDSHLCPNSLLYNELCTPIANLFLCPILFSSKHLKFSYNLVYYAFGFAPCHFHCANTKKIAFVSQNARGWIGVANLIMSKIKVQPKIWKSNMQPKFSHNLDDLA